MLSTGLRLALKRHPWKLVLLRLQWRLRLPLQRHPWKHVLFRLKWRLFLLKPRWRRFPLKALGAIAIRIVVAVGLAT